MTESPNAQILLGVFGAILDERGRILLVERSDVDMWCLPGGLLEVNESVVSTLTRECREEIGVEVRQDYLVGIYSDPQRHAFRYRSGLLKHFVTIVFACEILAGQPISASLETRRIGYFARDELPRLVPSHEVWILDALAGDRTPRIR